MNIGILSRNAKLVSTMATVTGVALLRLAR